MHDIAENLAMPPWPVYVQLPDGHEISMSADNLMTVKYLVEEALLKVSSLGMLKPLRASIFWRL